MTGGTKTAPVPRVIELFWAFFQIGVSGFGGVLPWARRVLVDKRGTGIASLADADRFLSWICETFEPHLGHRVLEVGAGVGEGQGRLAQAVQGLRPRLSSFGEDLLLSAAGVRLPNRSGKEARK